MRVNNWQTHIMSSIIRDIVFQQTDCKITIKWIRKKRKKSQRGKKEERNEKPNWISFLCGNEGLGPLLPPNFPWTFRKLFLGTFKGFSCWKKESHTEHDRVLVTMNISNSKLFFVPNFVPGRKTNFLWFAFSKRSTKVRINFVSVIYRFFPCPDCKKNARLWKWWSVEVSVFERASIL